MAKKAIYRVTVVVRGKEIEKRFRDEREAKRWLAAFESQKRRSDESGVTEAYMRIIYR